MNRTLDESTYWDAVVARDGRHDGTFFYGVLTTGVYCRPSCGARRPNRENVRFFTDFRAAEQAGLRPCLRCRPLAADRGQEAMLAICRYIDEHLDEPLTLASLSKQAGLSPFHFQRRFKAATGITPRQYADAKRLALLKDRLDEGRSVTYALHEAGYSSTSRLYERTDAQLGMTPTAYQRGGAHMTIRYATIETELGWVLIGATERGVCSLQFGDGPAALEQSLADEFPAAKREADPHSLAPITEALHHHLQGDQPRLDLPLDVRATAFQRRVWEHLQSIPRGETRSYTEVAAAIGSPNATRAVARACASNPVALAIPCHRVVRSGGALAGYRWGVQRKQRLLAMEQDK